MRTRARSFVHGLFAAILSIALLACGGPPDLPNADTMEFDLFSQDPAAGGLTMDQGGTTNVEIAAVAVWAVSTAVWVALAVPRLTFAATITEKAERDGDWWVWQRSFPLAGWESDFRAKGENGIQTEMRISGTRAPQDETQDFLWYTGSHQAGSGNWEFFDPDVTGPVIRIDWRRDAADDKELTFTNVRADSLKLDDQLNYLRDGTVASMAIHDERSGVNDDGVAIDFTVSWDLDAGSGKYVDRDGVEHCWDTIANGQVDLDPCPADWP